MAEYDLVIRNGTVVDGTGLVPERADVGVKGNRIVAVGRIREKGTVDIDADGHVVTPGFIDGHTHMDAQVFWDPLGTSPCFHGVTTAVMGNCGFTLAPVHDNERELVLRNLERAEDIPAEAMAIGVRWGWERFAGYLDAVEQLPKGINYAAYIGHSALRTWAMGERAFDEPANQDDLARMADEVQGAIKAGAVGFTTSRSDNHMTADGRPVASRIAAWDEVVALVTAMADAGGGVFEISNETVMSSPDPAARAEYMGRLGDLAVDSGAPTTFGVTSFGDPSRWIELLDLLDRTGARGGRMFGQSSSKESAVLFSFKTWLPYDRLPEWKEVRRKPLDEQEALLRQPEVRARLVAAARDSSYALGQGPARPPDYEIIKVMEQAMEPNPSLASVAQARGVHPAEALIDISLETGFERFFTQISGNADPAHVEAILCHPRTVPTFSDNGAHVSQMINASLQTQLLARWVREREVLTLEEAVRMITLVPARIWGLTDRGMVRPGAVADLNIFDASTVGPDLPEVVWDLPGGAKRLVQTASGFLATIVAGQVLLRDGAHTGALPGTLLRRGR